MNLYPRGQMSVERRDWPMGGVTFHIQWQSDSDGWVIGWIDGASGVFDTLETRPGQAAPTDNYDITIKDELGSSIASVGNRDTANAEQYVFYRSERSYEISERASSAARLCFRIENAGDTKCGEALLTLIPGA